MVALSLKPELRASALGSSAWSTASGTSPTSSAWSIAPLRQAGPPPRRRRRRAARSSGSIRLQLIWTKSPASERRARAPRPRRRPWRPRRPSLRRHAASPRGSTRRGRPVRRRRSRQASGSGAGGPKSGARDAKGAAAHLGQRPSGAVAQRPVEERRARRRCSAIHGPSRRAARRPRPASSGVGPRRAPRRGPRIGGGRPRGGAGRVRQRRRDEGAHVAA